MFMAIMVMATVEKANKQSLVKAFALSSFFIAAPSTLAGEWSIVPSLGLTETFTDNVELTRNSQQSSLVSQLILGIETEFKSRNVLFSLSGTETFANFSHDSELNDDFQTLQAKGLFTLWQQGPQLVINSSINNVSKNDSNNGLADIVSGDTVQQITHNAGFQYNTTNSDYIIASSIIYNLVETEDDIGESQGYTATLTSQNGSTARKIFWQINGQFTHRENNNFNSKNHAIESKVGIITPYKLNPFIRFYDEKISGNVAGSNPNNIPTWGPGIRYLAAKHLLIDLSYNYVQDDTNASNDYIAASIDWQPSLRTSLTAGYSKRFFDDSYNLDFTHKTKRLINSISYHETIEVFDRNNFQVNDLGIYWCPIADGQTSVSIEGCFVSATSPSDQPNYQLVPLRSLTVDENNEFTLNKRLNWQSTLALSRTTFTLDLSGRERTSLSTNIVDEYLNAKFNITRRTSKKSDIGLSVSYNENTFDKDNLKGIKQKDTYKIISTTYNRKLASSLKAFITLQYLDRDSTRGDRVYTETRASINITKDF